MSGQHNKHERRQIRRQRIRKRVRGSVERPRLSVFRSSSHIYAQVIDDTRGVTLATASSREGLESRVEGTGKTAVSQAVGKLLAERAKASGVTKVPSPLPLVAFSRTNATLQLFGVPSEQEPPVAKRLVLV